VEEGGEMDDHDDEDVEEDVDCEKEGKEED
jgi:hypothetical protein